MPKVVSKSQAGFFGMLAGGAIKKKGLPASKAKEMLRGTKVSNLPNKVGKPMASTMSPQMMIAKGQKMVADGKAMIAKAKMM